MKSLFTSAQSRQIDALLIERTPVSGYELMCRAAQVCCRALLKHWPDAKSVIIMAGYGNNGGDGYALGKLLIAAGLTVSVCEVTAAPSSEDAERARKEYLHSGGEVVSVTEFTRLVADVLVDALFGTGLNRTLTEAMMQLIDGINQFAAPVLSVDIPSGLNADTGQPQPCAVQAKVTVTFIVRKQGMYTAQAKDYCGEIIYDDLHSERQYLSQVTPSAYLACPESATLPAPRKHDSHKGDYGSVLIVGGDFGMVGAVCLAGIAALRCGAGKVRIATRPEHAGIAVSACPALMACGVSCVSELSKWFNETDVVVVGPGLGQSEWSRKLFAKIMEQHQPKVVDADALVLLSREPEYCRNWIMTPHPGEARALLGGQDIQHDRYAAGKAIVQRYGGVCVLKGSGTLVCSEQRVCVCTAGNPGMASAGMGDVLSGVVAALIAQGMPLDEAAISGVCLHALAGDRAAADSPRGLIASDLMPHLRTVVN